MSAAVVEPGSVLERFRFALRDTGNTTRRYVLRTRTQMDMVVGSVLVPVIFIVLFGYVFGSAIHVPGGQYHAYLMSGLFAQSTLWASAPVAVAVATDMSEGVIDRLRTLPISRSSVLLGRAISNLIVGLPSLAVSIVCALVIGWRPEAGIGKAVLGFALLQMFGFAMCWIGAFIGMIARSPQSADTFSMLPAFILGFVSNVFVPTQGMPAWLRTFAEWNPLSAVVAAARRLFGTTQGGSSGVWSLEHPVITTIAMGVLVSAIFIPLTVRMYSRRVR